MMENTSPTFHDGEHKPDCASEGVFRWNPSLARRARGCTLRRKSSQLRKLIGHDFRLPLLLLAGRGGYP